MTVGKRLHLRLFLEGVEVPVISAQVSININAPSAASIQIVPLDEAMDFHPRTMVHLFFLDQQLQESYTADKVIYGAHGTYRLLFSGELVAFSVVKQQMARQIVVQAVDFSNLWDSAHATALEFGVNGNAFTHAGSLYAGAVGIGDDVAGQHANHLINWMQGTPKTEGLEKVGGLAKGIICIMEAMGGVPRHSRGVNDFFTVEELRCRLLQQIAADEQDTTPLRMLKEKVFYQWMISGLNNIGQQVTFRSMLLYLFQFILYEFVPNPTAKFEPYVSGKKKYVQGKSYPIDDAPEFIKGMDLLEVSVLYFEDTQPKVDKDTNVSKSPPLEELENSSRVGTESLKKAKAAFDSLRKRNPTANPLLKGPLAKIEAAISSKEYAVKLKQARDALIDLRPLSTVDVGLKVRGPGSSYSTSRAMRLKSQIVRPDCWFAAPPRCNVIFPEMYSQITYDRNWLSECTRSMLQFSSIITGNDRVLNTRILSPQAGGFGAESVVNGSASYRNLMKHELHTGIVPRVNWLPDTTMSMESSSMGTREETKKDILGWGKRAALFEFFKYRFESRQVAIGGKFNPFIVCGFPAAVIQAPLILKGKDLPDIPSGDYPLGTVQKVADAAGIPVPAQLVGMVAGVSHSISQEGATTSVTMNRVRKHRGIDDEFLDVFLQSSTTVPRIVKSRIVIGEAAAMGNQKLIDLLVGVTPQLPPPPPGYKVSKSNEKTAVPSTSQSVDRSGGGISTESKTEEFTVPRERAIYSGDDNFTVMSYNDRLNMDLRVPNPNGKVHAGSDKSGVHGGKIVAVEVLDSNTTTISKGTRAFNAVAIYEEVHVKPVSTLPFEDAIRPNWFSKAYSNHNIGPLVYQKFFGCSSVVDELIVEGATTNPIVSEGYNGPEEVEDVPPETDTKDLFEKLASQENSKADVSVEKAISGLSYLYGKVVSQGLDVDAFIRAYVDRPIATMQDMLGSPDLQFSIDGNGNAEVTSGTVGFHSTAIHETLVEKGGLAGLIEDPVGDGNHLTRVGNTDKEPIPPAYDVRKAKQDRVKKYAQRLRDRQAFRG